MNAKLQISWSSDALYLELLDMSVQSTGELIPAHIYFDIGENGELVGVEIIGLHEVLNHPRFSEFRGALNDLLGREHSKDSFTSSAREELELNSSETSDLLLAFRNAFQSDGFVSLSPHDQKDRNHRGYRPRLASSGQV